MMKSTNGFRFTPLFVGVLVASLSVTGCENTIEPFSEEATYSIYGYLSLSRQQQFVRVKPLHAPLDGGRTLQSLDDVTVTLTNQKEDETEVLRDSVIIFRDGNAAVATHNYWTDTPIQPETEYRLVIEDSSGTTTTAATTTPPLVTAQSSPERGDCRTDFSVDFPGIKKKRRILSVNVGFRTDQGRHRFVIHEDIYNADHGTPDNAFTTFRPESMLADELGYRADNPNTPECETVCSQLATETVTVQYTYAGENWYGSLPERLVDPIDSPTVTNGSGYFGSIARNQSTVRVDTTAIPADDPSCL